jgi:hypothetical protein
MTNQQSAIINQSSNGGKTQIDSRTRKMYCLFDASVIVSYFIPHAHKNPKVHERASSIIESVRSGESKHFFFVPNFCIAEVFSTFAKLTYGAWNRQVRKRGKIDRRLYKSLRKQFQTDIHNAALFYHYELSRYHVLAVNLVAPVDHYFKLSRGVRKTVNPAGTFDQLIVAMGIHLTKIHGTGNVVVITADYRLSKLIQKCRSNISDSARKSMQLDEAEKLVGIPFESGSFPLVLNLDTAKEKGLKSVFGKWPLPCAARYKKPHHLKSRLSKGRSSRKRAS